MSFKLYIRQYWGFLGFVVGPNHCPDEDLGVRTGVFDQLLEMRHLIYVSLSLVCVANTGGSLPANPCPLITESSA